MRGVYADTALMALVAWGSSPHARGLPVLPKLNPEGNRIIPACAGFTICRFRARRTRRDHPRMRGVYWTRVITAAKGEGSSPHARGLRLAILGIPTVLESTTPRFPSLLT